MEILSLVSKLFSMQHRKISIVGPSFRGHLHQTGKLQHARGFNAIVLIREAVSNSPLFISKEIKKIKFSKNKKKKTET